jgi:hypothetical protein
MTVVGTVTGFNGPGSVAVPPDGSSVYVGEQNTAKVQQVDPVGLTISNALTGNNTGVYAVACLPGLVVGTQYNNSEADLFVASQALSQFNYAFDPVGQITTWGHRQSKNKPTHALQYDAAGQLIAAQAGAGAPPAPFVEQHYFNYDAAANRTSVQRDTIQNALVGGTVTNGDNVSITVADTGLSGGQQAVGYTVAGGDTLTTIAGKLAANFSANANLQAIGVSATASGTTIAIRSVSPNVTTYSYTQGGNTETVDFGINKTAQNITIGGTGSTKTITIRVHDASPSGGYQDVAYTTSNGQSAASIAQNLVTNLASLPGT